MTGRGRRTRGWARFAVVVAVCAVVAACGDGSGTGSGSGSGSGPGSGSGTGSGPPPALVDVAASSGVAFRHTHGGTGKKYLFETMGSGVAASDLDGDGRPDLLFVQSGTLPADEFAENPRRRAGHDTQTSCALYLNQGSDRGGWRFRDATDGSGLEEPFYGMGLAVGDTDADGDRDVWVAAFGFDRFFVNDGDARFTESAHELGLRDRRWTIGGAFLDHDLDGDLDLYALAFLDMGLKDHRFCGPVEHQQYCHVDGWPGLDDTLWVNDGTGAFTDGTAAAGLAGKDRRGLAVIGSDWDDDGDTDLFVANDSQANLVWRNEGDGTFADISGMSGADLNDRGKSEACMGSDMGDLDGDGDPDLYVVNFEAETNTLYRNDGGGFFTDVSNLSGTGPPTLSQLGFGTVFLDVENDGDLDIYVANGHIMDNIEVVGDGTTTYAQPDQLLLNDGRGRFALADPALGTSLGEPRVGRGLARADLDGDGDHDLVVTNSGDAPWLLRNDLAHGHAIAFRLRGPGGRADAEGAKLTLTATAPDGSPRTWVRELTSGGSYESASDAELLVGLGDVTRVETATIRWPGGAESELGPLEAGRRYTVAFAGEVVADEAFTR